MDGGMDAEMEPMVWPRASPLDCAPQSPDQTSLPTSALLAFCFQTHHCLQAVLIKTDVSQLTFKTKPQLVSREGNIKEVFFFSLFPFASPVLVCSHPCK